MNKLRTSINPYGFSLGIFGVVLLNKLSSYLAPLQLYFSFSSFIVDRDTFRLGALLIALLIPCIVGFCLFYVPYYWLITIGIKSIKERVIYRYLTRQAKLTARAVGFFSALFLSWPFIVYWDILVRPDIREYKAAFFFSYCLFFIAYAYFSELGTNLALIFLHKRNPTAMTKAIDTSEKIGWTETVRTSFMGALTSGIATYLVSTFGSSG